MAFTVEIMYRDSETLQRLFRTYENVLWSQNVSPGGKLSVTVFIQYEPFSTRDRLSNDRAIQVN